MIGKLLIFSAPSGSGKTTIVNYLTKQGLNIQFSISACSRESRKGEVHGKDYYFLTVEEFKKKIEDNAFLEWEEVYENHFYGTLKSEVERIWESGNHAIFDIDVEGGLNLKKQFGDKALSVFIMPPSIEELEKRLRNRSTDAEDVTIKRIAKAEKELSYAGKFDRIIVNKILEEACEEALIVVKEFIRN